MIKQSGEAVVYLRKNLIEANNNILIIKAIIRLVSDIFHTLVCRLRYRFCSSNNMRDTELTIQFHSLQKGERATGYSPLTNSLMTNQACI